MSKSQRLSSLDAGFLNMENDTQQMHVGSLLIFEGPVPAYGDFVDHLASCLDSVPRYRQRVHHLPLDLTRPIWVDDPHFSLAYHLRNTAIPAPGTDEQLRALVGRVMAQRLDLHRPLWEMWLVEGLPQNRWAVISKTHHAMIDGLAGKELIEIVLDRDPEHRRLATSVWRPQPAPSWFELATGAAAGVARFPLTLAHAAASAARALRSPSAIVRYGAVRAYGLAQVGRRAVHPTSVLNGPLGPHRRWGWARGDLAAVKAVKRAAGCTVNDVVLAAIAGGFRSYLAARDEPVDDVVVRSLVPVSIRAEHHSGRLGNLITAMVADLPVGIADPSERLAAVAAQMNHLKASGMGVGVEAMVSAADFVPATLMTLGARVYAKTGQRVVNTVTTNIPGPQYPLHLLGCRLLEMFPYIPIAADVRISIGIVSYDGHLTIGATGDYDAVPDLDQLCTAIEVALDELAALTAP